MNRSSKGLSVEWTKGMPDKDKQNFQDLVRHSTLLLGRLNEILDERLEALARKEASEDFHDSAGYPFNQAFVNGRRAEILSVKRLLQFIND